MDFANSHHVRKCKEIPGQHLFQYYSADGQRHAIESADVNDYLHRHAGLALSAKDFQTWGGTVKMVEFGPRLNRR